MSRRECDCIDRQAVADGTDSAKFKIGYAAEVRDVLFKSQSIAKNDTKITERWR